MMVYRGFACAEEALNVLMDTTFYKRYFKTFNTIRTTTA